MAAQRKVLRPQQNQSVCNKYTHACSDTQSHTNCLDLCDRMLLTSAIYEGEECIEESQEFFRVAESKLIKVYDLNEEHGSHVNILRKYFCGRTEHGQHL
eukprot:805306-Amphidinium_carterae.1